MLLLGNFRFVQCGKVQSGFADEQFRSLYSYQFFNGLIPIHINKKRDYKGDENINCPSTRTKTNLTMMRLTEKRIQIKLTK